MKNNNTSGYHNKLCIAVITVIFMAGCKGTTDPLPISSNGPQGEQNETVVQMTRNINNIVQTNTADGFTNILDLPTVGSINYSGNVVWNLSDTNDSISNRMAGSLEIDVTFGSASVNFSGTASNFVDAQNNSMSGALSLSETDIDINGNPNRDATILISANGTLTDSLGQQIRIFSQLEGDFWGSNYNSIAGNVVGSATAGSISQRLDGIFATDR